MKYTAEGHQVQKSWDRTRFDLRKWSRERGKEDSGRVYCSWSITRASHRGTCKDFSFSSEWGESRHRLMKRKMTRPRNRRMETLQWRKVTHVVLQGSGQGRGEAESGLRRLRTQRWGLTGPRGLRGGEDRGGRMPGGPRVTGVRRCPASVGRGQNGLSCGTGFWAKAVVDHGSHQEKLGGCERRGHLPKVQHGALGCKRSRDCLANISLVVNVGRWEAEIKETWKAVQPRRVLTLWWLMRKSFGERDAEPGREKGSERLQPGILPPPGFTLPMT